MRASIQLNPTNYIHFDTPIVADTINKTGEYKTDKILVKRWGEESDKNKIMYLLKSDEKPNQFTGIINLFFEREGYGVNEHDNGINTSVTTKMTSEMAMESIHSCPRKKTTTY